MNILVVIDQNYLLSAMFTESWKRNYTKGALTDYLFYPTL